MANEIHIKQINLHHCKGATSLISKHLHEMQTKNKQLIVMAQEPWINRSNICGIDEKLYKLFYTKAANSKPRACIATTKTTDAVLLPQFSTSDICTIKLLVVTEESNEEILLSSVYMPYECNEHVPDLKLREIIKHIQW